MKEQMGFPLQIPIFLDFRHSGSLFCLSGRVRAPGKWMKSPASFGYGSKIIGEAKSIQLPNPAEPAFGDPFKLL